MRSAAAPQSSPVTTDEVGSITRPAMIDLMSGPKAPLSVAFALCGWQVTPVDFLINKEDDISEPACQKQLLNAFEEVIFAAAALDCSTKSRARAIKRRIPGGGKLPEPLRSEKAPMGLPGLQGKDKDRVE